MGWGHQALDHLAILQMALDDFVNVGFVHIGVPNALGINHRHRAA